MIGIFDGSGNRLTVSYNSLSLNVDSDSPDSTYALDTVTVVPQYSTNMDPNPNGDGSKLAQVNRTLLLVRMDGTIRAQSMASLFDKIKSLAAAFDPAMAYASSPTTDGAMALDFSTPTTDTSNYATGLVTSRYYARARGLYIPPTSAFTGTAGFFTLELVVPDPVRYSQTEYTLVGAGTANLSAGNHKDYPTLTIAMAGAGAANYTITVGSSSLVLDLSGCVNADSVVVDMATKSIKKNGTETQSMYVSGDWFALPAASNTVSYTNTTNATSTLAWRRAWSI